MEAKYAGQDHPLNEEPDQYKIINDEEIKTGAVEVFKGSDLHYSDIGYPHSDFVIPGC